MLDTRTFDLIAEALEYPTEHTPALTNEAAENTSNPPLADALGDLATWLDGRDLDEVREVYTRMFDLSPVCTMNVGYHVFGDTYARGALLAGLVTEMRGVGLDPGNELPDYLPNLLRLAGRLSDEEDIDLMIRNLIVPGLDRMDETLDSQSDPWGVILAALRSHLADVVGGVDKKWKPRIVDESGFLGEAAQHA